MEQPLSCFSFDLDEVKPSIYGLNFTRLPEQGFRALTRLGHSRKIEGFSHSTHDHPKLADVACHNGLIDTIDLDYHQHHPLQLSPSDFIVAIGQGLSHHVNKHTEKLRHHFVDHAGKSTIVIRRPEFELGKANDLSTVFPDFATEIQKRVKNEVYRVVVDGTSTATTNSRLVSELNQMDFMKQHFHYRLLTVGISPPLHMMPFPRYV